jgi:hypothetical protein
MHTPYSEGNYITSRNHLMLSPVVKDMAMVITEPKTWDIGYTEPVKNIPVQVSHIYFEIIPSEHSI